MFQVVEVPCFGQEDVHQYVGIVHGYPFGVAQAVHGKGACIGSLACEVAHRFDDGGHLAGRVALADDEVVAYCIVNLTEVGDDDFFPFLSWIPSVICSMRCFASFIIHYYN